ncbi:MAG TPA: flagellar biosynthesis protein FlaG [Pseudomonas xinjiangensis]|uniref:Flagellar biosynthesis protein FlaG n=2 Tax=root TaxID=1 RepID=A0A7V1FRA5_9GAMM|nr:flagellar biosynthesis protein FlaG [Halopseudomonas xinjiangensis]HEC46822.1 flagellar biosynthesis protein FlaG [Halopseudomonas xinjiangensis]
MDMGILKPFELNRTTSSAASVEAGLSSRPVAKQTEAAQMSSAPLPVDTQSVLAVQQPAGVERDELQAAVADMQDFVQSVSRDINFKLDDASGRVVVNVTDRTSGDIIRQIPSEEALRLAESLSEIRSLLFKAEA